jgi:DnaK suppressor protein
VTAVTASSTQDDHWTSQREELLLLRARLIGATVPRPASDLDGAPAGPGDTDHVSMLEQRELDAALEAMEQRELARVERALGRIDAGTYGTCASCGGAIHIERLDAVPTAVTCVGCLDPELSR